MNNAGTNGNWWSATANNTNNQYNLNYNNGSLNTNNNNKRNNLWLKDADGNVKTCAEWARVRGIAYDTMWESWRAKGYVRVDYGA